MSEVLLARFADCIFWLARYVERAENLARILDVNETFARDSHGGQNWRSIVQLNSDEKRFFATHDTASVHSVVNFYVIDNDNPTSFHQAPLNDAASKLAAILREEKPDIVVTYAEDGIYGHPDHVKAHFVTIAALDAMLRSSEPWTPMKLYYTAIPRSLMQKFREQMPEDARRDDDIGAAIQGTPDELVTTKVDVNDYVDRKRQAFAAHVSQNDPNSWFANMQDQIYRMAFGTEYYQLARGKPGSALPEDDLFAGIS